MKNGNTESPADGARYSKCPDVDERREQNGNTVQNDEWVEKPDSRQRQTEAEQETQDHGGFRV